ncbi:MAG TPA: hypothetical protein VGK73_14035 [Polyangiaceae bacterium]
MTMTPPDVPKGRARAWLWLFVPVLAVIGIGLLIELLRERRAPDAQSATPRPAEVVVEPADPKPARPLLVAADRVPIAPHDPSTPDGPVHPHPITPAHARIFRENRLLGALNGALDVRDGAGVRRLLATYRAEFPEDPHALHEGYEIIADCLEHPGDASEAAARKYYATQTASTLRRYVRRSCWER